MASSTAPAEERANANHEAKVVPATVIMHLVHVYIIIEKGNNKGKSRDKPVPQPLPESGSLSIWVRLIGKHVWSRCTTRQHHYNNQQQTNQQYLFHLFSPWLNQNHHTPLTIQLIRINWNHTFHDDFWPEELHLYYHTNWRLIQYESRFKPPSIRVYRAALQNRYPKPAEGIR